MIEEGDPVLVDALRAAGLPVEGKPEMYRFGELNVERVRRILARDTSPEVVAPQGKPPELCPGCSHRGVFETLRDLDCIVAGDIGCYTLGVLPPFSAMDTCVCMGASIGVGLGLRHVLPEDQARRVVSVIGDSTFVHSGLTGLAEMVYNPPPTGHLVLILDNSTTTMTGQQEHPGAGRRLDHTATSRLNFEETARAMGVQNVHVRYHLAQGRCAAHAHHRSAGAQPDLIDRRPSAVCTRRPQDSTLRAGQCPTADGDLRGGSGRLRKQDT
ncbi:MAG: thiamine pyrophosphate-dependent enzyme [Thermochromatium sp.]